jgi:hypothetical protein
MLLEFPFVPGILLARAWSVVTSRFMPLRYIAQHGRDWSPPRCSSGARQRHFDGTSFKARKPLGCPRGVRTPCPRMEVPTRHLHCTAWAFRPLLTDGTVQAPSVSMSGNARFARGIEYTLCWAVRECGDKPLQPLLNLHRATFRRCLKAYPDQCALENESAISSCNTFRSTSANFLIYKQTLPVVYLPSFLSSGLSELSPTPI